MGHRSELLVIDRRKKISHTQEDEEEEAALCSHLKARWSAAVSGTLTGRCPLTAGCTAASVGARLLLQQREAGFFRGSVLVCTGGGAVTHPTWGSWEPRWSPSPQGFEFLTLFFVYLPRVCGIMLPANIFLDLQKSLNSAAHTLSELNFTVNFNQFCQVVLLSTFIGKVLKKTFSD